MNQATRHMEDKAKQPQYEKNYNNAPKYTKHISLSLFNYNIPSPVTQLISTNTWEEDIFVTVITYWEQEWIYISFALTIF
jgi:hypothetical protein